MSKARLFFASPTVLYSGLTLIACIFGYLAVLANTDLAEGSFVLFTDETITFYGVQKILQAPDLASFLYLVLDGDDHRYGRILWNSMAMATALPAAIGGESWQIIAGRLFQTLVLFAAYLLLALCLVRSGPLRLLTFFALMVMPCTAYYLSMPKPEPQQLLALALFFHGYQKQQMGFGRYWIFLGLAFGAKISTLPVILVPLTYSYYRQWRQQPGVLFPAALGQSISWFLGGLALAVPILAPLWLAWTLPYLSVVQRPLPALPIGVVRSVAALLALLLLYFAFPLVEKWFAATFLNTTHPLDDPDTNALSWLTYWADDWMQSPHWLSYTLVCLAVVFGILVARISHRQPLHPLPIGFFLIAAGTLLNLAVLFNVKRLWDIYLFTGSALTLTGLIALLDDYFRRIPQPLAKHRITGTTGLGLLLTISAIAMQFWLPAHQASIDKLASRTDTDYHRQQLITREEIFRFFRDNLGDNGGPLNVALADPFYYMPETTARINLQRYGRLENLWQRNYDIILYPANKTPAHRPRPRKSSSYYPVFMNQIGLYMRHVSADGTDCKAKPCYNRVATLSDGTEVLFRQDLQEQP